MTLEFKVCHLLILYTAVTGVLADTSRKVTRDKSVADLVLAVSVLPALVSPAVA